MRRVLITGSTGFIGCHLVRILGATENYRVSVVPKGVDLTSRQSADEAFGACEPVDYIIHAADLGGDAEWSSNHPYTQLLVNSQMTLNTIEAWRTQQPQARFVGLSSLWAYPEAVTVAKEDEYWAGRMCQSTEHYGLSKKLLGVGIQAARREHGLKGTVLVLGSVYGPSDVSKRVVPSLIRRMRATPGRLDVWSDPNAARDFVYVDDQVAGILQHLDYDGELLNITSGQYATIGDLVAKLSSILGFTGEVSFKGSSKSLPIRMVDVSQATNATGWPVNHSLHSLDEGLRKTVESGVGIPQHDG